MATAVKRKLSSSTDGKAIKIGLISTPGDTIHTAVSGTTAGTFDEIWLWAYNSGSEVVVLTVQFGGESAPDQNIILSVPYKSGLIPITPGLILQNSAVVKAFASTGSLVTISGFVNSITD